MWEKTRITYIEMPINHSCQLPRSSKPLYINKQKILGPLPWFHERSPQSIQNIASLWFLFDCKSQSIMNWSIDCQSQSMFNWIRIAQSGLNSFLWGSTIFHWNSKWEPMWWWLPKSLPPHHRKLFKLCLGPNTQPSCEQDILSWLYMNEAKFKIGKKLTGHT